MTRHAMLNNVAHKDLRVITRYGAQFGDNVASVLTFPTEFGDIQREYPIFFRKDQNGEYQPLALLGFEQNENLFLEEDGTWNATYVPGMIARGPFLIGFQEQQVEGNLRKEPMVHVDLDHPRVSYTEGEPVFLPQGGNSRYLERVATILKGIHEGLRVSKAMFAAYTAFDLIEPVKVEIKFNNEMGYKLEGLYTISQEKLGALDGESLAKLNKSGFLYGAFLVLASMGNVKKMIDMKHRRRQRQAQAQAQASGA